jgi:hypothetical protein
MNYSEEDISSLQNEMLAGKLIPDLNRVWLHSKIKTEPDPTKRQVYEALLCGYDHGELKMYFDVFMGEMKYAPADIN